MELAKVEMPPGLLDAYLRTDYRVADRGWTFVLRVGVPSSDLAACHEAFGVGCSAYITAYNPKSEATTLEANTAAQARLEVELAAAGFPLLRGYGEDPTGCWPSEPSLLVLGISGDAAQRLGRAYGQNAILIAGLDAVPKLDLLV